ncbi:oligopeptide/dipeptide ABC transporter, ATP-binding protein, C-terminal domain-containing protein [Jatrophihabitans endophyticus]|uniref:Oligopeptide/dipeptide ABC transporter, ATP-binding protein, C-terminal domain-containing protein n=1 Tax=Jatrophihabitans endophyticus TaxID=1206085 RepID=A0A1M5DSQ9_9ACTN|nr:dipeptide/oligopeptide/nickel ABC transporter permease/ATP-binding protein [Jatrophihabitans endophyticus]SHF70009.1 oligopeptide/dipeptide ABC transporter, ATP-binding protein, C-terminal domain-containing protein [Jatrophihabitans endophyticus]
MTISQPQLAQPQPVRLEPAEPEPGRAASRRARPRARWWRAFRTPVGATAAVILLAVLVLAVVAPLAWSGRADAVDVSHMLEGASGSHLIGTDNLGRDLFYRTLVGTRLSVALALLATAITVGGGLLLGSLPALVGRRAGRVCDAVVNVAVAFPPLLVALFFAVVFGVGVKGAVLAIGVAGVPAYARLVQTLLAAVAERDFVAAARVAGVGRLRVLGRHMLPNVAGPLVVNATIGAGSALLSFAGLSFLGLGVQPPDYDWGRLLKDGLDRIYENPGQALLPGAAVLVTGLAFNLFGEAVATAIGAPTTLGRTSGRSRRGAAGAGRPADAGAADDGSAPDENAVLDVADLRVTRPGVDGPVELVRGVGFTIGPADAVGVVGESGSGKSLTALAVAQLVEHPLRVGAGRLRFLGTDLRGGPRAHRTLLGTKFALVFQDPATSFNPTQRVGAQLAELARAHHGASRRTARERAVDRLRAVRIPAPERRARQLPHEFSGGMRQRAMIGLGLMGRPALIVADEPTTALDVTVQQQVLDLLASIRREQDAALLLISHDVSVIAQVCDRVLVMYAGRIVEELPADELGGGGLHPYTRALVAAVPDMTTPLDRPLPAIPGRPADPADLPPGCAFAPRCPLADDRCRRDDPALVAAGPGRRVACWHAGEERS